MLFFICLLVCLLICLHDGVLQLFVWCIFFEMCFYFALRFSIQKYILTHTRKHANTQAHHIHTLTQSLIRDFSYFHTHLDYSFTHCNYNNLMSATLLLKRASHYHLRRNHRVVSLSSTSVRSYAPYK